MRSSFGGLLVTTALLGSVGCESSKSDKAGEPAAGASSTAKASAATAPAAARPSGGTLKVKSWAKDEATVTVGGAFAFVKELSDGLISLEVRAFNDGAKDVTCETELDGDKPVGGTNWAVRVSSDRTIEPGKVMTDEGAHGEIFVVHTQDPWKGEAHGWSPFGSDSDKTLEVKNLDQSAVTLSVKFESGKKDDLIEGDITAKVCKWEKRDQEE